MHKHEVFQDMLAVFNIFTRTQACLQNQLFYVISEILGMSQWGLLWCGKYMTNLLVLLNAHSMVTDFEYSGKK